MFADGHLLTQLIPIFLLLKIGVCGDFIDLDPAWIRIRIRIHITAINQY